MIQLDVTALVSKGLVAKKALYAVQASVANGAIWKASQELLDTRDISITVVKDVRSKDFENMMLACSFVVIWVNQ
jgi:hypothetical protein